MKQFYSIFLMIATMVLMMGCGGDDASSAGGSGSGNGNDKPTGTSSIGAWYMQEGSYLLVWDFADGGTVSLHLYEISGDVYYKTTGTGHYTKKDNTISFTMGGQTSTATIIDDVMHLEDPDLGSLQLKKVSSSVQSSINTMENYFDQTQEQAVGEWYSEGSGYYYVMSFESTGKGKLTVYYGTDSHEQSFTWTRGNNLFYSSEYTDKFNIKNGVLTLIETDRSTNEVYTMRFEPMTDEIRKKIEDMQNAPSFADGYYIEKNPDMSEWFMVEIHGNKFKHTITTYGKAKSTEGTYRIIGNNVIFGDVNGDGVVDDNDKMPFTAHGNEITIGEITLERLEVSINQVVGTWQTYRVVNAVYHSDGSLDTVWDKELTGTATDTDNWVDNENVRIQFDSQSNFQSWYLLQSGQWETVQTGTYSFSGRTISCKFTEGGKNYQEDWNIIAFSGDTAILELWDSEENYLVYYMKRI